LIWGAASQSTAAYLTIPELYERGATQRMVRVTGFVVGESIVWDARALDLRFEIVEQAGTSQAPRLSASYRGPRPDMFRDGAQVVLEGRLSPDGSFVAETMLLQCPSKYQEAE
jgi:cytochrome c-type biogenesis protein CcmE